MMPGESVAQRWTLTVLHGSWEMDERLSQKTRHQTKSTMATLSEVNEFRMTHVRVLVRIQSLYPKSRACLLFGNGIVFRTNLTRHKGTLRK